MKFRLVWFLLLIVAGASLLAYISADRFDDPSFIPPHDFLEYWAAGRATLDGSNPYDGTVMKPLQLSAGRVDEEPVMMWNPPWSLPISMLVGWMPWRAGQIVWLLLNLTCLIVSPITLWRLYGGPTKDSAIAVFMGLVFTPSFFLLLIGQISGLLLLGVVGFLACVKSERWLMAGVFASLTSLKPHLFAPFAVILVLEATRDSQVRKAVLVGAVVLALGSLIPLFWNPHMWSNYLSATLSPASNEHHTLRDWAHPTLGYALRTVWPGHPFRVMFLPLFIGLPFVVVRYWRKRDDWNWLAELPVLLLVSLVLAPYGAWAFDLVVLLVPIFAVTPRLMGTMTPRYCFYFWATFGLANVLGWTTLHQPASMMNRWILPLTVIGYTIATLSIRRFEKSPR